MRIFMLVQMIAFFFEMNMHHWINVLNVGHCAIRKLAPIKVVWYLPIIPRFRRMYHNAQDAKNLRWHSEERICDGKLRHPAYSPQWAKVDHDYPNFGKEPRNLHLALSSDGINLHGMQSNSHSTWLVVMIIYNLPPWLCMKRKFMMLSMLIPGPK